MALNVIKGVQNAENVLVRIDPLDLDSLPDSVLARTEEAFGKGVTPLQSVNQMLDAVRKDGDDAVLRYAKLLDGSDLEDFRVTEKQMAQARASVSKELHESLELAAQRVRDFHESTMPSDWIDRKQGLGFVMKTGRKYELLATNQLSDGAFATPVITRNRIYLRTLGHLYCIEE